MAGKLNQKEISVLKGLEKLWLQANQEVLETILSRTVSFDSSQYNEEGVKSVFQQYGLDTHMMFPITISSGILGNCFIMMGKREISVITDLIIGGDGLSPGDKLDELHFSVLEEAINQMAGNLETILSQNLQRKINLKVGKHVNAAPNKLDSGDTLFSIHNLKVGNLLHSPFIIAYPSTFIRELVRQIESEKGNQTDMSTKNTPGNHPPALFRTPDFPQFDDPGKTGATSPEGLQRILDIPLELTVVLGKTEITLKELAALGPGAVIELEKMAGEPVELFANQKFIGYGEVIVIEENFGIRVIDVEEIGVRSAGGSLKRR